MGRMSQGLNQSQNHDMIIYKATKHNNATLKAAGPFALFLPVQL